MSGTRKFKDVAVRAVRDRLRELGFTKRKGLEVRRPLSADADGIIRIDPYGRGTYVEIDLGVLVHLRTVEAMIAALAETEYDPWFPSAGCLVMYTLPGSPSHDMWACHDEASLAAVCDSIAATVQRYVLPFMQRCSTPEGLLSRYEEDPVGMGMGRYHFTLPIEHHLIGDDESAENLLAKYSVEAEGGRRVELPKLPGNVIVFSHPIPRPPGYLEFAARMRAHISSCNGDHSQIIDEGLSRRRAHGRR